MTYRLGSTVIDPGDMQDWAGVSNVLLTHAHFDHIYGLNMLWEANNRIKVYTNDAGYRALLNPKLNLSRYHGEPFTFDHPDNIVVVADRENVTLDNGITAQAYFTPGHNDSCISWVIDEMLFTGDAYIPGIKVVTNLPGADRAKASRSIDRIKVLANNRNILPGHKIDESNE